MQLGVGISKRGYKYLGKGLNTLKIKGNFAMIFVPPPLYKPLSVKLLNNCCYICTWALWNYVLPNICIKSLAAIFVLPL
jgi:hypothetical protein